MKAKSPTPPDTLGLKASLEPKPSWDLSVIRDTGLPLHPIWRRLGRCPTERQKTWWPAAGHLPGHSAHPGGGPGGSRCRTPPGALGAPGRGTRRLARSPPGGTRCIREGLPPARQVTSRGTRCTREGHPPTRQVTSRRHSVHSGGAPGELYHLHSVHTVSGALPEAGHHGTCRAALRLL